MKRRIEALLSRAIEDAHARGELATGSLPDACLEVPKDRQFGDIAANCALTLARLEKKAPRTIAGIIVNRIDDREGVLSSVEVAGPGFINLHLAPRFWHRELAALDADPALGVEPEGQGRRAQVEFVSANPTGPLTVGHGRNAVLGDSLARLLEATGWKVEREYYFNNAGRQMSVLAASVRARYLELAGRPAEFPEDGYQGEYIRDIARGLKERHGEALAAEATDEVFRKAAEEAIFGDIRATQDRLGVRFDQYFNEDSLYASGAIDRTLEAMAGRNLTHKHEGALWLRGEAVGLEQDRVLVKSSGEPAYRLPDIAYHENKLGRRFDAIVDVLGADHIAEHQEVVRALAALGFDVAPVRAVIYQFVTLTRHGEQVKMSTRRAQYVTLDELVDEVGVDATRFFFLTRKSDTHLEFDLELAKKRSVDNPVYYVQYAHARIANLFVQAGLQGTAAPAPGLSPDVFAPLVLAEEFALVRQLATYGEMVNAAARDLEPHRVVFYLQELAATLHRFYNHHRVLGDDQPGRVTARLAMLRVVQRTLAAGLGLVGVTAPERM
ncbi:MAG TPA: arginine--tRNA ligase [Candidatus Bathyarchaeia archaeon]|nr:arginine--tRNA ligase [Candidatus Bathyarchaeia archaeon]